MKAAKASTFIPLQKYNTVLVSVACLNPMH